MKIPKKRSDAGKTQNAGGPHLENALDDLAAKFKNAHFNEYFIFGSIALVLVIGLYALFSPSTQNALTDGNPACGKIVVAADGPFLRSNVATSLTGAKYFLVINPLSTKLLEAVKNPFSAMQVPPADVAYFVAGKGEEAVVAGDIDPQCYRILAQFGVRSYGGYTGRVKDVVDLYRQASISPMNVGVPGRVFGRGQGLGQGLDQSQGLGQGQSPNMTAPVGLGQSFYTCPNCKWRVYPAANMGQNPICPNCRTILPLSNFTQDPIMNQLQNMVASPGTGFGAQPAPPIYSNAVMPHDYRGVCSNCHQILKSPGAPNSAGSMQPVAWTGSYGGGRGSNPTCPLQ